MLARGEQTMLTIAKATFSHTLIATIEQDYRFVFPLSRKVS